MLSQGDMAQDPGNEILAAECIFHFQQITPGCSNHLPLVLLNCSPFDAWLWLSWILNSSLLFIVLLQEPIGTRFCNHDKQIQQAYDYL